MAVVYPAARRQYLWHGGDLPSATIHQVAQHELLKEAREREAREAQ